MQQTQLYTTGDYKFGSVIFNKFMHVPSVGVTRVYNAEGADMKFQYSSLTGEIIVIDTNTHNVINIEYTY